MQRITKVGVLSLGRVMGSLGALLGVLVGIVYATAIGIFGVIGISQDEVAGFPLILLAGVVLFGTPIALGVMYFVLGLLYALLLNVVFRLSGGLELRIER